VTHQDGVAPGDDPASSFIALLVMLTQQHVPDVVRRGGGVDAIAREVIHV
jgi:hypothetical protein